MSQENVEATRRGIDAWNRRDLDGWLADLPPDFEWSPASPAAVERSVFKGHAEIRKAFILIFETWDEFRFEESEIRDLGISVLWLGRVHARGKSSQVELDNEFAAHIQPHRADAFLTWREAFEAAGLSE